MIMIKEEIIREYKEAKYQKTQIDILAQLNCVPKEEIIRVLREAGEMPEEECKPRKPGRPPKNPPKEAKVELHTIPQVEMPDTASDVLFRHLECLDEEIKAKRNEVEAMEKEYTSIADFLKRCGKECVEGIA